MTEMVICPACSGKGGWGALVDGADYSGPAWMNCGGCRGGKMVPLDEGLVMEEGRVIREKRIAEGLSLRDFREKTGISMVELGRVERGINRDRARLERVLEAMLRLAEKKEEA